MANLDKEPGCLALLATGGALLAAFVIAAELLNAWAAIEAAIFGLAGQYGRAEAALYALRFRGVPACAPAVLVVGAVFAFLLFGRYRGRFVVMTVVTAAALAFVLIVVAGGVRRLLGYA